MDQDALVRRFQKKDIIAFERLYETYWENICGVVNTIVQNKGLAEEISQDVFTKIWNNSDNYAPSKGRFFTWLLTIARNAAMVEVRSKLHKTKQTNPPTDYFLNLLEDGHGSANQIDAIGLKKLVKNLREKCIQIIDLFFLKGYSQKEVSEELDIRLGSIKARTRSCLSRLRENITLEWT